MQRLSKKSVRAILGYKSPQTTVKRWEIKEIKKKLNYAGDNKQILNRLVSWGWVVCKGFYYYMAQVFDKGEG